MVFSLFLAIFRACRRPPTSDVVLVDMSKSKLPSIVLKNAQKRQKWPVFIVVPVDMTFKTTSNKVFYCHDGLNCGPNPLTVHLGIIIKNNNYVRTIFWHFFGLSENEIPIEEMVAKTLPLNHNTDLCSYMHLIEPKEPRYQKNPFLLCPYAWRYALHFRGSNPCWGDGCDVLKTAD